MLIEFSVTNFLSISEKQTLNLVAGYNTSDLPGNVLEPDLPGMTGFAFLKGAGIYGANASGKSNILAAIAFMRSYVRISATEMKPDEGTGYRPFLLAKDKAQAPSEFEIFFAYKGIRYDYGFSLDKDRILSEWLYSYPKGRPRKLFVREYDEKTSTYHYTFSKGSAAGFSGLEQKTRPNALFLSVGVQFNATELMPPYEWFEHYLRVLNLAGEGLSPTITGAAILGNPDVKKLYCTLLREADLGIEDIEVVQEDMGEKKGMRICLLHSNQDDDSLTKLSLGVESDGTRRLFALLAPWHDVLERGVTLFVDELESSMHPLLTRKLIAMVCGHQNKSGAQLVFTTHNTHLLEASLLRRDQVWFAEKERNGATRLYPLTDYRPRKDESLQKGYLAGRYGAIPILKEELSFYG